MPVAGHRHIVAECDQRHSHAQRDEAAAEPGGGESAGDQRKRCAILGQERALIGKRKSWIGVRAHMPSVGPLGSTLGPAALRAGPVTRLTVILVWHRSLRDTPGYRSITASVTALIPANEAASLSLRPWR